MVPCSDPHLDSRLSKDFREAEEIFEIKFITGMGLRKDEKPFGLGKIFLNLSLEGGHCLGRKDLAEIIEAGRKEIRVDDRDLVTGVTKIA
jgi:hypothetical protein